MLIEREAALKAVHEAIAEGKSWYSALSNLPSAEKTGKWLWVDGVRCSRCNYKLQTTGLPSYCPHCGSRMVK